MDRLIAEIKVDKDELRELREICKEVVNNEDAISRQAAIKAIEERAKGIKNEDTLNGLAGAAAILFDLPPVVPKWIPVSERLPEERGIYLTYIINEYDNRFQYPMTACFLPNKVGCLPQWFPDDETASNNVVAWMPLPEPYKAESEDKK